MKLKNNSTPLIKVLDACDENFENELNMLLDFESKNNKTLNEKVEEIIECIKVNGDSALIKYCEEFDKYKVSSTEELKIDKNTMRETYNSIDFEDRSSLNTAANRIYKFHERQELHGFSYTDEFGSEIAMKVLPIEKVGIYVPGGTAAYPSSVLMNSIPARVANVKEITMTVPSPNGKLNPMVIAAAHLAGVDKIYKIGGAQAIAALAYGTESISRVDKIVGPGNSFVAAAKKQVYGVVGIDMIAGPSEILVICDGKTNPDWIALDLFSQAEHDESAQSILLTDNWGFLEEVYESMEKLLPKMDRESIIKTSLINRGALIYVENLTKACQIANKIAPEHLELCVENSKNWSKSISNAGSVFLGKYSSEALGDYCVGPNHVLPTSGSARFSSGLSVHDFKKRMSVTSISESGANALGRVASKLAKGERLSAHALAAEARIKKPI
tara:strand:+ start:816 stop:2144 length:1329 start_codon:yes stop_codon:yes gene_type:complete